MIFRNHRAAARLLGATLLLASSCASLAGGNAHAAGSRARSMYASRATTAMLRLDGDFLSPHDSLYHVAGGQYEPQAALWPTSQALAGAIAVANITHTPSDLARIRRIIGSLKAYAGTPRGVYHARVIRSLRYYDDNNWIALDFLDAYPLLHDPALLTGAEEIFHWLTGGWDARQGGGIEWGDGHYDRPTVSTAPAITIGMRLAAITHDASYKTWALRMYAWENSAMRAPSGLYWDHIDAQGRIDKDIVSYNQGAMIDANVAAYHTTGQRQYLAAAKQIATAMAAAKPGPWRDRGNYAAFDAIYFQSLAHLDAASPGAASLAPVQAYVDWAWPYAQQPRAAHTEDALLEQAAIVLSAAALT